jgi:hypothetical protein
MYSDCINSSASGDKKMSELKLAQANTIRMTAKRAARHCNYKPMPHVVLDRSGGTGDEDEAICIAGILAAGL